MNSGRPACHAARAQGVPAHPQRLTAFTDGGVVDVKAEHHGTIKLLLLFRSGLEFVLNRFCGCSAVPYSAILPDRRETSNALGCSCLYRATLLTSPCLNAGGFRRFLLIPVGPLRRSRLGNFWHGTILELAGMTWLTPILTPTHSDSLNRRDTQERHNP